MTPRDSKAHASTTAPPRLLVWGLLALAPTGCGGAAYGLNAKYSMATGCPISQVAVKPLGGNLYLASGCEGATTYECNAGGGCTPEPEESATEGIAAIVIVPKSARPAASSTQPRREKTKAGNVKLVVDIELENQTSVRLSTEPKKSSSPFQVQLLRIDHDETMKDCDLGVVLNGERVALPPTRKQNKSIVTALTVNLPQTMISDFGTARQVTLGACDTRFSLTAAQLSKVRSFAAQFEEEVAWNGDPKKNTSSTLLAPAGGWRTWTVASVLPPARTNGKELSGNELFELLKPSIYKVEALLGEATSQGSAVAVSSTELLTNCHVVEGARKILVQNDKQELVAKLSRSLPAADRCVLTVDGVTFTPVRGVRNYAELKVGEPLYTLGAPSGLELSLSNGILSGLRQEAPMGRFVQTTAPISPGSSGGGLFDNRGNLVGITTLVLVGRSGLNQSLNFAIAAEEFWQSTP